MIKVLNHLRKWSDFMKMPYQSRNYRKYSFIVYVLLISICFLPIGVLCSYGMETLEKDYTETKNVLILNSYDEGYNWTSDQSNGIYDSLMADFDDIRISVEHMDWKYHPGEETLKRLYDLYKHKYSNTRLDLIFTTDNAALEFALKYREEFLSNAPIVFSGITIGAGDVILKGKNNVVGVFEVYDTMGTMEAASRINPDIENVYLISDNTESGKDLARVTMESGIRDKYNLYMLNDLTLEQIIEKVSKLSNDSILIFGAYTIDSKGLTLSAQKFAEIISEASAVPIYDTWDIRIGSGVLGGKILRGKTMGRSAAGLGTRILNGEPVDKISNIDKNVVEYVFDYNQLKRFNIPLRVLPEGSIVINKPFSFFETYKNLVIGAVFTFVIMCIYIMVLINNIRKRKLAEKELSGANQELLALYEQISAADQQLKNQLDELVEANDKLQVSEEKYRLVAEAANDIIWEWELGGNKLYFSRRLQGILGYSEDEIKNITEWSNIIASEDVDYVRTKIESIIEKEQKDCTCEYRVRHKKGKLLWLITKAKVMYDQLGYPYKIVGSHTDITQLKEHQDRILQMAYHDTLTNLPNRSYLKEYVEELIIGESYSKFAIVYIDIDDFKTINDNFGHSEGDRFLKEIGMRFCEMSGDGISIFRLGGDEYVIVLKDVKSKADISDYLNRIFREFAKPINLAEMKLHITLSAGAVIYPDDGTNFDDLLKNADIAMYQVKNKGKNSYIFFDESMQKGITEKMYLENSLREAVKRMDFTLSYQPIVDLASEKICSLEALIRWNSPELGPVPPAVFIKLAEENGLIIPIGNWVLRTGCGYAAKLADDGYPGITVSVNISPVQLMQADFVQNVKAIAASCGVEPGRINLEITESVLIDSFEASLRKLNELRDHGFHISLDDFGQGYSSLTYLRRLPINIIKIDKAFIDDIRENEGSDQIVYAITELSHRMGLTVYAEGVETEEQLRYLKSIECDGIQGYLISKPLPESEIAGLLNRIGCIDN